MRRDPIHPRCSILNPPSSNLRLPVRIKPVSPRRMGRIACLFSAFVEDHPLKFRRLPDIHTAWKAVNIPLYTNRRLGRRSVGVTMTW